MDLPQQSRIGEAGLGQFVEDAQNQLGLFAQIFPAASRVKERTNNIAERSIPKDQFSGLQAGSQDIPAILAQAFKKGQLIVTVDDAVDFDHGWSAKLREKVTR